MYVHKSVSEGSWMLKKTTSKEILWNTDWFIATLTEVYEEI